MDSNDVVKVFTTPFCPLCRSAKNLLSSLGVKFEEVNVMKEPYSFNEVFNITRQISVPQIKIGKEVIVGFREEMIMMKLRANKVI